MAIDSNHGNPHDVDPAILRAKTRLYKLCEISPRRRWRDGFIRVFWRSQLLPPKPRPMACWSWNLLRESSRRRGEEPLWKECACTMTTCLQCLDTKSAHLDVCLWPARRSVVETVCERETPRGPDRFVHPRGIPARGQETDGNVCVRVLSWPPTGGKPRE